MPANIKNQKATARAALLRSLSLPKDTRAIALSYIHDQSLFEAFRGACQSIGVVILDGLNMEYMDGADLWVADILDTRIPARELSTRGVVPVIPIQSSSDMHFSEFDPMKFTGNAFLFASPELFQMFEKLVRALENMRYAGDRHMLLRNIEATA